MPPHPKPGSECTFKTGVRVHFRATTTTSAPAPVAMQRLDLSDRIDPPIGLLQQIPRQPDIPSTSVRILQPDRFSSSIYPSPRGRLPCACQYPTRSSVTLSIRRIEPRGSHRQGRLGGGRRLGRCRSCSLAARRCDPFGKTTVRGSGMPSGRSFSAPQGSFPQSKMGRNPLFPESDHGIRPSCEVL
jgi:hypothetical protein